MTITKELYLAILSMDAYNQGYGVGINHGKTSIGSATKLSESNTRQDSNEVTAGFYAVAYTMGADAPEGLAGKTVISCRGTDNLGQRDDLVSGGAGLLRHLHPLHSPASFVT